MDKRTSRKRFDLLIIGGLAVTVLLLMLVLAASGDEITAQGDGVLSTVNPTITNTFAPACTAPACAPGEVYYCPDDCPRGCGTECATPTPSGFLPLALRNLSVITGEVVPAGSPCTTDPCLPCLIYAIQSGGITYHLTVDGHRSCFSGGDQPP